VGKSVLKFYSDDSPSAKFIESYPLSNAPESIYISTAKVYAVLDTESAERDFDGLIKYEVEPIDYRNLYCNGIQKLNVEGMLEGGA
jgi:hypothetical protein